MDLANGLFRAICYNILGDKQLRSRIIGFRGELEFLQFLQSKSVESLSGGMFVPIVKNASALDSPVYFTIVPDTINFSNYEEIYTKTSRLNPINAFLITYSNNVKNWSTDTKDILLEVPNYKYYLFQNSSFENVSSTIFFNNYQLKNRPYTYKKIAKNITDNLKTFLSAATESQLIQLYAERYFFDCLLSNKYETGIASDIDIIFKKGAEIRFGEVKEKDLARSIKGFGLDLHRSADIYKIKQNTQTKYFLFVRQINNQQERKFVAWQSIRIEKFIENTNPHIIQGGTGMRSEKSSNPTKICPVEYFNNIS